MTAQSRSCPAAAGLMGLLAGIAAEGLDRS